MLTVSNILAYYLFFSVNYSNLNHQIMQLITYPKTGDTDKKKKMKLLK